jgi:hypothetical protein
MQTRPHRVKFVTDPVTGLPALSAGPNAPVLTSKEVEEILLDADSADITRQPKDDRIVPL